MCTDTNVISGDAFHCCLAGLFFNTEQENEKEEKKILHTVCKLISFFGLLSHRGLNLIKLVYNPDQLDGWLAHAFNQLDQHS